MKNLTVLYLICLAFTVHAQSRLLGVAPLQDGKIVYTKEVHIKDNIPSKDILYARALMWFNKKLDSTSKEYIQTNNLQKGVISGNRYFSFWKKNKVQYKVTIEVAEGIYKYKIYDVCYTGMAYNCEFPLEDLSKWPMTDKLEREVSISRFQTYIQSVIASIKLEMEP